MQIHRHVQDNLRKAVSHAYGLEREDIELSHPADLSHGDYASNIALQLAKQLNDSPRNIAEKIASSIDIDGVVEKVEIAGPGFINFFIKKEALFEVLVTFDGDFGISKSGSYGRVMLEFGQPNTHKMPHIGHLFSYIYGESLARLLEAVGVEVYRVNYQGDVGPHVAKCLWALQQYDSSYPKSLEDRITLLQQMYQQGSAAYLDDPAAKEAIDDLNKKIYAQDASIKDLWIETRQWCLDYYKEFESRLSIRYERSYLESEVFQDGIDLVKANEGTVFEISEGAYVFRGSNYGLHDRVFVTSRDTATYEAKDLALEILKMREQLNDLLIITTAHEQNEYFRVVFKALETIRPDLSGKLLHIGFGMVNLKTGKMGSRTGNIIGAIDLVDGVISQIKGKFGLSEELSEQIGIGAVKYSFLKTNPLQDTVFDLEESISQEGNSGPYLQYTYARCKSILSKAEEVSLSIKPLAGELSDEESILLRTIYQFSEYVELAAKQYAPNLVAGFLYELAKAYNGLYQKSPILTEEDPDKRQLRLILTNASSQVLKQGLMLLGIDAPERM